MQIVVNNHMQAQLRLQYIECEVPSVYHIRLAGPGDIWTLPCGGRYCLGALEARAQWHVSRTHLGGSLSCSV